jgi:hypothetical protein
VITKPKEVGGWGLKNVHFLVPLLLKSVYGGVSLMRACGVRSLIKNISNQVLIWIGLDI